MLLMYWGRPGERFASPVHAVTAARGYPSRDEVVEAYTRETGFEVESLSYYIAFACFKLAVIVEGIYARHLAGLTVGEGFERIGDIPPTLAQQGLEALG
jgi:aminoglycoside phosphotransferase (APT) family kinase protein